MLKLAMASKLWLIVPSYALYQQYTKLGQLVMHFVTLPYLGQLPMKLQKLKLLFIMIVLIQTMES